LHRDWGILPAKLAQPRAGTRSRAAWAAKRSPAVPAPANKASILRSFSRSCDSMRIPIQSGQVFRREAGHHSDLKPATSPELQPVEAMHRKGAPRVS